MINWLAAVLCKPPAPKRAPLPADLQAIPGDGTLTLINYAEGTADQITVLLDGEPWDCGIEWLGGGLQTTVPMEAKPASVAVRWVGEDGEAREWSYSENQKVRAD